jgi:hypothetical protein
MSFPSAAKAGPKFAAVMAWLKPCPFQVIFSFPGPLSYLARIEICGLPPFVRRRHKGWAPGFYPRIQKARGVSWVEVELPAWPALARWW